MSNHEKVSAELFIETVRRLQSSSKVAAELGLNARSVRARIQRLEKTYGAFYQREDNTLAASPGDPQVQVAMLRDQLRALKAELAGAKKDSLTDEYVKREIVKLKERTEAQIIPEWLITQEVDAQTLGVPTLFASDWHWGETVFPSQINGVNEFNLSVAHKRAMRMVRKTITLLTKHLVNPKYPGIVFALGGDMLSGDIHEELSESNEIPVMPALVDLYGVLVAIINILAQTFGRVFIPCVTGNHGRNTHKMRAKSRNYSNFDWMLYVFLQKHFEDDNRVTFHIPDGSDAHWRVYGHRYCMTHGDQFRGGDGMIGALGPIIRGDHKKRSRNGQIDLGYDTLILGHWHQLIQLQRLIVNGSLKGYDEYAAANNFGYELPQQALWITHPKNGITHSMPIHLEDKKPALFSAREWVTWAA